MPDSLYSGYFLINKTMHAISIEQADQIVGGVSFTDPD
jgi:hypothetical protein